MREDPKLVWRMTLKHINKDRAYGRQGKAPTGLIFAEAWLLTVYMSNARGWPLGWQISGPRKAQNLQMRHPRDWQGGQIPRRGREGGWAHLELTDALLTAKPSFWYPTLKSNTNTEMHLSSSRSQLQWTSATFFLFTLKAFLCMPYI